ncbi:hypothetical protein ONJ17_27785, partial [Salmonella enterica subsp. enterica serovar Agona]|nr:hypothetical protein [Salmonella enterica subsp. enterica serovar Agona]
HFKCDKYRISDYLNLYGFLRDIYQIPGIAETVNMDHIRHHYFQFDGQLVQARQSFCSFSCIIFFFDMLNI